MIVRSTLLISVCYPPKGCDTVYFPNAFTPGKQANNIFRSSPNITFQHYQLRVYSRWGQLIFTSNNTTAGWDGNLNGQQQPAGAYVWMATYTTRDGRTQVQRGSVILIR